MAVVKGVTMLDFDGVRFTIRTVEVDGVQMVYVEAFTETGITFVNPVEARELAAALILAAEAAETSS